VASVLSVPESLKKPKFKGLVPNAKRSSPNPIVSPAVSRRLWMSSSIRRHYSRV